MSGRAERLRRLLAIRKLNERLDRGVVQAALTAVAEVEAALGQLERSLAEARVSARAALTGGERGEWMLADAQSEVTGWDRGKLKKLLASRRKTATAAMAKFLESRREHEQVKRLVEDAEDTARIDALRRAQVAADESFLSRRTPEL